MTLDFVGTMILIAVVVITAVAFTNALSISTWARHAIATVAGIWTGMQLALYQIGAFQAPFAVEAPLVGVMVATPIVAVGMAAAFSQRARTTLLAPPMPLLIGLNAMRIFGGFFLLLAAAGRLDGPFPYSAGWGDVITSVLAAPLAIAAAHGSARPSSIWWWNLFGTVDLIAAVTFGTLSSNGSAVQIIFAGEGSAAVQHMPWLLIPTVLVPFWLIVHGIVFAQLRQRRSMPAET